MKKFLSFILIASLAAFSGCSQRQETPAEPETETAEATVPTLTGTDRELKAYLDSFCKGESPVYGAWRIRGSERITYIFRNDGLAELAMGSEGQLAGLTVNDKKKTLETELIFGLNGKYSYSVEGDEMTLTSDDGETVLEKVENYSIVPASPEKTVLDSELCGWWRSEDNLVYYFGSTGIMYSNAISMETCYTYSAKDGVIDAVYDVGGENSQKMKYKLKNGKLTLDGNKYESFTPEGFE